MDLKFKATFVFHLFSLGFCVQNPQLEEPHFTQSIVHPTVNAESEFDPVAFVPYITKHKPSAHVSPANCHCGVHDYIGDPELESGQGQGCTNASDTTETRNDEPEKYVTCGNATDKNQFPFIVALIYRRPNGSATHFCGGSLITSKLILTATHCLQGKVASKTEIWLNERDLLLSTETHHTSKIKAIRFIPHPEFNPLMSYNDISLIELSESVDVLKSQFRPICLPPTEMFEPTEVAKQGYTAGWGQTVFNGPKSDHLRHVDVPLITNKACNEESEPYYNGRVTTHMVCAGDLIRGGRDACPGDSGGPLFIKVGDRFRLIGIVSWGDRCSLPRRPGVYTRVSKYLRWIGKVHAETQLSTQCIDSNV